MSVRVSVVVPTFRRPQLVRRCLAALFAQDCDPSSFEIIVVEDGAGEGTTELIDQCAGLLETRTRERSRRPVSGRRLLNIGGAIEVVWKELATGSPFESSQIPASPTELAHPAKGSETRIASLVDAHPPASPSGEEHCRRTLSSDPSKLELAGAPCLRYIPLDSRRGPAGARNVGWRLAAGEIIAFTDDDCIPTPGWLRMGVAAFRPGVIGVSGRLVVPLSRDPTDYELNASYLQRSEFVTANCFYRRDDLEQAGGFDERFDEAWREDTDLIFTMMERVQGTLPFVHAPDAIVIHPVRPARWGISLLQQRKNMYNALLYKKHPSLYQQRLGRVTPWRYYIVLSALLVCFAGLLTRQPIVALIAAMVWMALTSLFCVQRLEKTARSPRHVAEMAITSVLIPPVALYWRAKGALKYRVLFL